MAFSHSTIIYTILQLVLLLNVTQECKPQTTTKKNNITTVFASRHVDLLIISTVGNKFAFNYKLRVGKYGNTSQSEFKKRYMQRQQKLLH